MVISFTLVVFKTVYRLKPQRFYTQTKEALVSILLLDFIIHGCEFGCLVFVAYIPEHILMWETELHSTFSYIWEFGCNRKHGYDQQ